MLSSHCLGRSAERRLRESVQEVIAQCNYAMMYDITVVVLHVEENMDLALLFSVNKTFDKLVGI